MKNKLAKRAHKLICFVYDFLMDQEKQQPLMKSTKIRILVQDLKHRPIWHKGRIRKERTSK